MNTLHRRLPAEWESHQATLLSFPYEGRDWPGRYHAVKWAFIEMIKKVTIYEPVILLVKSEEMRDKVTLMLIKAHVDLAQVNYIIKDTNRNWMRDSGPEIVKNAHGDREVIRFGFTGWAKYKNHKKDQGIPAAVASHLGLPVIQAIYKHKLVVLEGGSIDVNGCGTLITTEECLMDPIQQVRNKGFNKEDYEKVFLEYLGIVKTIWLGEGIEGDDTHGHVDDICRFVNRNTVVAAQEQNTSDPNHFKLKANLEILKNARLENGEKLNVVTIPLPERLDFEDLRLPASYVNFMVTNGCILMPTFNDKNDYKAFGILTDLFPDREVIGIHAIDLVWGQGTLHCLSHEIPEL
jgi:agmatine deiminase